ncbi:MAG: galactokinase [Desulfovibrio sp.]|nr:galactokinase [Desulfovibrio sp.]|tara:strand:+ start:29159 stop:30466 length:1308 start_codon:yes stop_codon:yes gene_type:complete
METVVGYLSALRSGALDESLIALYGEAALVRQKERVRTLLRRMERGFDSGQRAALVSAPGRTELGGNHTDHNNGVVLAAAVHFDCLALATPGGGKAIRMRSEGFPGTIEVDLSDTAPRPEEADTPQALIRGVADGLVKAGYRIGPFNACVAGEVPMGAGLSSSAAFEICVGQIFNQLFNNGEVPPLELARIGQRAENLFFGKPCGLMDQLACAVQGVLSIDFKDQAQPVIREVDVDFKASGYQLVVVDTGGSHADLTPEYAAIPHEMGRAARVLGQEHARGLTIDDVLQAAPAIRREAGDRAVLRLIHFIEETERAQAQAEALSQGKIDAYLDLVNASGDSSWRLLQNCISTIRPDEQGITLALALTRRYLQGQGAWRIQGGGFAGTIQAYVPLDRLDSYISSMEGVFGAGAVLPLSIRKPGRELIMPASSKGER